MEKIKIAVYMRVSTKEQADSGLGLEAQKRGILNYISYNFENSQVDYYVDAGITGSLYDERKELQKMLSKIKENKYDKCIIYKVDRLSRDIEISSHIKKSIINARCELISVTENFNLQTAEGNFIYNIQSVFAENERAIIKKRTEDSQISRLEKNEYPFRVSYGYRRIGKEVSINEDEAKVVRFIFNDYLIKHSFQDVRLNVLHFFNLKVSDSFIARILNRIQYKGAFIKNGILYENVLPSIVDNELFEHVQKIIKESQKVKKSECYLYGDLIHCSRCNCRCIKRSVKKKNKRYYYYQCHQCNKYINIKKKEYEISANVCFKVLEKKHLNENKKIIKQIKYLEKRRKYIILEYAVGKLELVHYNEIIVSLNTAIDNLKNNVAINQNVLNYSEMTSMQKTMFYQKYVSKIFIDFNHKCVDKIVYIDDKQTKK